MKLTTKSPIDRVVRALRLSTLSAIAAGKYGATHEWQQAATMEMFRRSKELAREVLR